MPLKIVAATLLAFLLSAPVTLATQDNVERTRAFQLYDETKYVEALPLFEKLAKAYPNDREVIRTYGLLVLTQTAYLKDAAARRQARIRGREILLAAQKLGADDYLVKAMVAMVPDDGGDDTTFSTKKEVNDAIREGEGAFARGEFPKALEAVPTGVSPRSDFIRSSALHGRRLLRDRRATKSE